MSAASGRSGRAARTDAGRKGGLETVAEGLETTRQLDLLRDQGCELGQGWLSAKALPADAAAATFGQVLGNLC